MDKPIARNLPVHIFRVSALPDREHSLWFRLAGLPAPMMVKHAELQVQEITRIWNEKPATPRQERFLRLRAEWLDGLTQRQAFDLIGKIAVDEVRQLRAIKKKPAWTRLVELELRTSGKVEPDSLQVLFGCQTNPNA